MGGWGPKYLGQGRAGFVGAWVSVQGTLMLGQANHFSEICWWKKDFWILFFPLCSSKLLLEITSDFFSLFLD